MEWKKLDKNSREFRAMLERRNGRFLSFFKNNGFEETRLIGDPEKPAILYKEEFVLSCYVHNFELRLMDKPFSENIVESIKLNGYNLKGSHEEMLKNWYENNEHRKIFKIKLDGTDLYLAGYNFLVRKRENPEGRYPVFAKFHPKVYFSDEKAKEIAEELIKADYKVSVV